MAKIFYLPVQLTMPHDPIIDSAHSATVVQLPEKKRPIGPVVDKGGPGPWMVDVGRPIRQIDEHRHVLNCRVQLGGHWRSTALIASRLLDQGTHYLDLDRRGHVFELSPQPR